MGQKGEKEESKSKNIKVTFDSGVWDIIDSLSELGKSDSGKINAICISWLTEKGIIPGLIKKRLEIK